MKNLIRHGDLLFRPVERPDKALTPRKSKIILEGEVTGHAHRLDQGEAVILDQYEKTWRSEEPKLRASYVHVTSPATVIHEEHHTVTLLPGLYEVIRAREFDYTAAAARNVRD